jgi:hypothetical protein
MPLIFTSSPQPLATSAPIPVGSGAQFIAQLLGPWQVGSDRYAAGVLSSKPTIAKLSGGTWSFPDSANAPTQGSSIPPNSAVPRPQFVFDAANNLIHILTVSATPDFFLRYCAYNIATDTYGSVVTSTIPANGWRMQLRSNGDLVIAHNGIALGDALKFVIVSAGAFGTTGTLEAGAANVFYVPLDVVLDSSDLAHIGYNRIPAANLPNPTVSLKYTTLTSSNTPGTPAVLNSATGSLTSDWLSPGLIWVTQDQILWIFTHASGSGIIVKLVSGTPVASPSWTLTTVDTTTNQNLSVAAGSLVLFGSSVYLFYANNNFVDVTSDIRYATYDGSSVSSVDVAWDAIANPVVSLPAADVTANLPSVLLISGVLEMIAQTEVNLSENPGLVYLIGATGSTITSLSPPSAVAGGPDFTLTVNGTNFTTSSVVLWNGSPLTTTFISAIQLTVTVTASLIASPGTATVTVNTGGTVIFTITAATGSRHRVY